jgi:hypothetical protein
MLCCPGSHEDLLREDLLREDLLREDLLREDFVRVWLFFRVSEGRDMLWLPCQELVHRDKVYLTSWLIFYHVSKERDMLW